MTPRVHPAKRVGLNRLGGTSFNLLAFWGTTSVFWICTPDTMPQIESPIPVLHTLSRRKAMLVPTSGVIRFLESLGFAQVRQQVD
ncbi:MAG: hypothetical protein ABSA70_16280 [Terriglobia bacterium]